MTEHTGFPNEGDAQKFANALVLAGAQSEVFQAADGGWTVRAYPPGFGSIEPAQNPKTAEEPMAPPAAAVGTTPFQTLLDFLAQHESGGNYNAYFGKSKNTNAPKLTSMKLGNVLVWQRDYVRAGSPSSAAGRYQIIRPTLEGLIDEMNLGLEQRFNSDLQDQMAVHLLKRRGLDAYLSGALSTVDFGNNVAKEWASMPVLSAITGSEGIVLQIGQSYYAGDGLNKALAGAPSFTAALESALA